MMWRKGLSQFLDDLRGIQAEVNSNEIDGPASIKEVKALERAIRHSLPPAFRRFLLTQTKRLKFGWRLQEGMLVQVKGEREAIYAGEFEFAVDNFIRESPQFRPDFESDAFDQAYRPEPLLALTSTPNGDQFAVILTGQNADTIRYLSHDLDSEHFYKVGDDIFSFFSNYSRLGFAGPESWIWQQFTSEQTTPIDARSAKALEFLELLRRGIRSPHAEARLQSAEAFAKRARYEGFVLPDARVALKRKHYKKFVELLCGYEDLLSGTIKKKFESLRKKQPGKRR